MEMKSFFEKISTEIENAVKKDINKILKEIGEERVYAIAFVTDSDCITLYLAINTYEYMNKKDHEYIELLQDKLSEEYIKKVKEGSCSITKWNPAEWGYSDESNSNLAEVSKLLFSEEEDNPAEYEKNIDLFFEAVTSAFQRLIQLKVFGQDLEEVTYFISISDDERTYEIENFSAKLLNSENIYKKFLERSGE